jgi:hypothetical protein
MSHPTSDEWHDLVRDVHTEHEVVKAERDALYKALRLVKACFDSRIQSSECINDHHPYCNEYITSILNKVDNKEISNDT